MTPGVVLCPKRMSLCLSNVQGRRSVRPGPEEQEAPESEEKSESKESTEQRPTLECLRWRKEQVRRLKMRKEVFPIISENTVIFANFNQLYKMDPDIFACWMNILKAVPNSTLWLLRFPPAGEMNLKKRAIELVGEEVASRLIFTGMSFALSNSLIVQRLIFD